MPAKKKETVDKLQVKQFRDSSSNFWYDNVHYHLNQNNEVIWCAGGIGTQERKEAVEAFIKRNKKQFRPREESILDKEEKVYITLNFGKFSGLKLNELVDQDKRYASWLYNNTTDQNIKLQLKELLKK